MSSIGSRRAAAAAAASDSPAYQERRDAIRAAAGRVFHRKGFAATKLNDVAEEAGMDRASLYYYVGSKEQLFREVVSDAASANIVEAERIAASEATARVKLARLIESLMTSFDLTGVVTLTTAGAGATQASCKLWINAAGAAVSAVPEETCDIMICK